MSLTKLENTATQKEVVKKLVEANDIIIDKVLNTYTKEEIDNKINNNNGTGSGVDTSEFVTISQLDEKLSMLDDVKGVIGLMDGLPEAYNGLNDILTSNFETVDEIAFLYSSTYVYARFNIKIDNETYKCYNTTSGKTVWRFDFTLTNNTNIEVYTNSGNGWSKTTTVSMAHNKQISEENLYLHSFDILDTNKENVWKEKKELDATCDDFNEAIENGIYKINGEAKNSPSITKGLLKVSSDNSNIYMEAVSSEKVEIRFFNGESWSEWKTQGSDIDLSSYYTKPEIDKKLEKQIGYIEYDTTIWDEEEPEIWSDCPEPPEGTVNTYKIYIGNYYYVYYFNKPITNDEIFIQTSGSNKYSKAPNITKNDFVCYRRQNANYDWSANSLTSAINTASNSTGSGYYIKKIYYHDFDIRDYNTNEVIRRGKSKDVELIGNFDYATKKESYKVKQETEIITNSPINEPFSGTLRVDIVDNTIIQILTDIDYNSEFRRVFNNNAWSEWEPVMKVEYGEHVIEETTLLSEEEVKDILQLERSVITPRGAYYFRVSPKKKFRKITGITASTDHASTIIAPELIMTTVMVNGSQDFMLFLKNKFIAEEGYQDYEGLGKLMGRVIKYSFIGY